jgi:hypothetical protein
MQHVLCAILQNPIPTNKPGVEPKRPPRPVNITTMVKLSPTVANHITVSWNTEYGRGYAIAVYLVRKLTSSELLQRLKTRGVRHSDFTRGLSKYSELVRRVSGFCSFCSVSNHALEDRTDRWLLTELSDLFRCILRCNAR